MPRVTLVRTNCGFCVSDAFSAQRPVKQSYETLLGSAQCVTPVGHLIGPALTHYITFVCLANLSPPSLWILWNWILLMWGGKILI